MISISRHGPTLTVRSNPKTEIYIAAFSHLKFKQLYRISHFNPIGIALTAVLRIMASLEKEAFISVVCKI
jgi:hypothetical protein